MSTSSGIWLGSRPGIGKSEQSIDFNKAPDNDKAAEKRVQITQLGGMTFQLNQRNFFRRLSEMCGMSVTVLYWRLRSMKKGESLCTSPMQAPAK
jgi:hypothetical protein